MAFAEDEVVDKAVTLTEGSWLLMANTGPGDTNRVFPAAIIDVTAAN